MNEEENEGGRETVSGEQPENPRQVEEEKVDDKAGDKDCRCYERQSHPGQEEIFLVKAGNIFEMLSGLKISNPTGVLMR